MQKVGEKSHHFPPEVHLPLPSPPPPCTYLKQSSTDPTTSSASSWGSLPATLPILEEKGQAFISTASPSWRHTPGQEPSREGEAEADPKPEARTALQSPAPQDSTRLPQTHLCAPLRSDAKGGHATPSTCRPSRLAGGPTSTVNANHRLPSGYLMWDQHPCIGPARPGPGQAPQEGPSPPAHPSPTGRDFGLRGCPVPPAA